MSKSKPNRPKKKNSSPTGIDWAAIFARRPDLEPPGYHETIAKLYPEQDHA